MRGWWFRERGELGSGTLFTLSLTHFLNGNSINRLSSHDCLPAPKSRDLSQAHISPHARVQPLYSHPWAYDHPLNAQAGSIQTRSIGGPSVCTV